MKLPLLWLPAPSQTRRPELSPSPQSGSFAEKYGRMQR
jgi:hypothetical protein